MTWLTFVVSLGAYALLILLIKQCTATRVSSLLYLTPPTTMLMDYFVFGNMVTVNGMVGLIIVAIGVVLTHRGESLPPNYRQRLIVANRLAVTAVCQTRC